MVAFFESEYFPYSQNDHSYLIDTRILFHLPILLQKQPLAHCHLSLSGGSEEVFHLFLHIDDLCEFESPFPNEVYPVSFLSALKHHMPSADLLFFQVIQESLQLRLWHPRQYPELLKKCHFILYLSLQRLANHFLITCFIHDCQIRWL